MNEVLATIVSPSHLGQARALAASIRASGNEHELVVLITAPRTDCAALTVPGARVISLEDIDIPQMKRFAFRYNPFELCNALKPFLLLHLIQISGMRALIYFDSDIAVFGSLRGAFETVRQAPITLTPHFLTTVNRSCRPSLWHLHSVGVFNAGFIGISQSSSAVSFLRWWGSETERFCIVAPELGLFVDQKWLDLAPIICDQTAIARHPGWNVAYWNLPERTVTGSDGKYRVNGQDLVFFHFSGFERSRPLRLTRHHGGYEVEPRSSLGEICTFYRELLETHDRGEPLSNPYARFSNGTAVSEGVRRHYLEHEHRFPGDDPFDCNGPYYRALRGKLAYLWLRDLARRFLVGHLRRSWSLPR